jgi:hypothetical protein
MSPFLSTSIDSTVITSIGSTFEDLAAQAPNTWDTALFDLLIETLGSSKREKLRPSDPHNGDLAALVDVQDEPTSALKALALADIEQE